MSRFSEMKASLLNWMANVEGRKRGLIHAISCLYAKVPIFALPKGGVNTPLWKRGAREDFLKDVYSIMRLLISDVSSEFVSHLKAPDKGLFLLPVIW